MISPTYDTYWSHSAIWSSRRPNVELDPAIGYFLHCADSGMVPCKPVSLNLCPIETGATGCKVVRPLASHLRQFPEVRNLESISAAQVSPQLGLLISGSLLAAFVLWRIVKQMGPAEAFLKRFAWGGAALDIVLFPAAVYGSGRLIEAVFGWMGLAVWQGTVRELTELLIVLAVSSGVARLIELWLVQQSPKKKSGRRESKLSQLARSSLFGFCLFVGLLVFLTVKDYSPTELYISTGAAAALIAFGMQQTLGDLFSGIALSIERPFRIGDWLRFNDGTEGEVTDINWRATRLRGWDNTTFVVPNGQLSRQSFTNLHGPDHEFAPWYLVRVSGDADPQTVKTLLEKATERCEAVLRNPPAVARLMDGTSNPYTYMVWVHFPNYPTMFVGREELYREIHRTLLEAGLQISADIHELRHQSAVPATAQSPGSGTAERP